MTNGTDTKIMMNNKQGTERTIRRHIISQDNFDRITTIEPIIKMIL